MRQFQAKELTPYEVGDAEYRQSVSRLASESLLLLAIHGVDAHDRVHQSLVAARLPVGDGCEVSATPSIAVRIVLCFFSFFFPARTFNLARTL